MAALALCLRPHSVSPPFGGLKGDRGRNPWLTLCRPLRGRRQLRHRKPALQRELCARASERAKSASRGGRTTRSEVVPDRSIRPACNSQPSGGPGTSATMRPSPRSPAPPLQRLVVVAYRLRPPHNPWELASGPFAHRPRQPPASAGYCEPASVALRVRQVPVQLVEHGAGAAHQWLRSLHGCLHPESEGGAE